MLRLMHQHQDQYHQMVDQQVQLFQSKAVVPMACYRKTD
jgi:hypothetical protein